MELNNIIFLFLIIILGYFLNKYSIFLFSKNRLSLLIDDQFHKPQAFHKIDIPRSGGLASIVSLTIFFNEISYGDII